MTLHFAYGSNMNRALMRAHCPTATALGLAALDQHRFIITRDGYASVLPRLGSLVHGVLWRLTSRDVAALNAYESIDSGLYRASTLSARTGGRRVSAMVYIARSSGEGRPKPGYMDIVLDAARDWRLPDDYVATLVRWSPSGLSAARTPESGEIA